MSNCFLGLNRLIVSILGLAILSLESLCIDVLLQVHYVEYLPLQHLETLSEILVLIPHAGIHLLILLLYHQMEIVVS